MPQRHTAAILAANMNNYIYLDLIAIGAVHLGRDDKYTGISISLLLHFISRTQPPQSAAYRIIKRPGYRAGLAIMGKIFTTAEKRHFH